MRFFSANGGICIFWVAKPVFKKHVNLPVVSMILTKCCSRKKKSPGGWRSGVAVLSGVAKPFEPLAVELRHAVKERDSYIMEGKSVQAKGMASSKALRLCHAWLVWKITGKTVHLEQSKPEDKGGWWSLSIGLGANHISFIDDGNEHGF